MTQIPAGDDFALIFSNETYWWYQGAQILKNVTD